MNPVQEAWIRAYCAAMPWAIEQCGAWPPDQFPHKVAEKCVEHAEQAAHEFARRFQQDPRGV